MTRIGAIGVYAWVYVAGALLGTAVQIWSVAPPWERAGLVGLIVIVTAGSCWAWKDIYQVTKPMTNPTTNGNTPTALSNEMSCGYDIKMSAAPKTNRSNANPKNLSDLGC